MERTASHLCHDPRTSVEIWCDEEVWPEIRAFFYLDIPSDQLSKEGKMRKKKLQHIFEVVLKKATRKDILEKECVDTTHCVWVLKMFQGSQNTRIICQRIVEETRDCLVLAKLIEKKKSQNCWM